MYSELLWWSAVGWDERRRTISPGLTCPVTSFRMVWYMSVSVTCRSSEIAYPLGLGVLANEAEELSWVHIRQHGLAQGRVWGSNVDADIAKSEGQAFRDRASAMLQVL